MPASSQERPRTTASLRLSHSLKKLMVVMRASLPLARHLRQLAAQHLARREFVLGAQARLAVALLADEAEVAGDVEEGGALVVEADAHALLRDRQLGDRRRVGFGQARDGLGPDAAVGRGLEQPADVGEGDARDLLQRLVGGGGGAPAP